MRKWVCRNCAWWDRSAPEGDFLGTCRYSAGEGFVMTNDNDWCSRHPGMLVEPHMTRILLPGIYSHEVHEDGSVTFTLQKVFTVTDP